MLILFAAYIIYMENMWAYPYSEPLVIQWQSSENPPLPWASGNSVAIQCVRNVDPSVHWNATGESIVGSQCVSSVLPVCFQWSSSSDPVCSNYAN